MTASAVPSYAGYRFPAEVVSHAVWLVNRHTILALAQYWCRSGRRSSRSTDEPGSEQVEVGTTIHLALDHLQLRVLSFGLAI